MSDRLENGPLQVGDVFLEKYQVLGVLGRGGHGYVYRALNLFMGREVAIKVLSSGPGGLTDELRRRGRQEAALLGKLEHPNIVRVHDAGISDEGNLYIVMELLKGQTLAEQIAESGPLTVPEGLRLLGELCDALDCAHAEKAIHRDLKPANIFLTEDGTPKILDFGVAKIAGAVGFQTQKNMVVGTILYMSPEQIRGELSTERSDIYALGLVAFQMFHGSHPLLLDEPGLELRDRRRVAWLQAKKPTPRLDNLIPGFPEYVARLVNVATVKVPGRRFESAREMGSTARKFLLRYETEVSLGYQVPAVPPRAKPRRPQVPREQNVRSEPRVAALRSYQSVRGCDTEPLFALSSEPQPSLVAASGEESAPLELTSSSLPRPSDPAQMSLAVGDGSSSASSLGLLPLELSRPYPMEGVPLPETETGSASAALEGPELRPSSTAASVAFAIPRLNPQIQVGLLAALGFAIGLSSLALMPRPPVQQLLQREGPRRASSGIVTESARSGPPEDPLFKQWPALPATKASKGDPPLAAPGGKEAQPTAEATKPSVTRAVPALPVATIATAPVVRRPPPPKSEPTPVPPPEAPPKGSTKVAPAAAAQKAKAKRPPPEEQEIHKALSPFRIRDGLPRGSWQE